MINITHLIKDKKSRETTPVNIPKTLLNQYVVKNNIIEREFFIDNKYAKEIGLLFIFKSNELGCANCYSFHGAWVDADEVKEECYKLSEMHIGHKGPIAHRSPCNFYNVTSKFNLTNPNIHEELEKVAEETFKTIDRFPEKAYKTLLNDLEKSNFINRQTELNFSDK